MSARWTFLSSRKRILSVGVASFVPGCSKNSFASFRVGIGGISSTTVYCIPASSGFCCCSAASSSALAFCHVGMDFSSLVMIANVSQG